MELRRRLKQNRDNHSEATHGLVLGQQGQKQTSGTEADEWKERTSPRPGMCDQSAEGGQDTVVESLGRRVRGGAGGWRGVRGEGCRVEVSP